MISSKRLRVNKLIDDSSIIDGRCKCGCSTDFSNLFEYEKCSNENCIESLKSKIEYLTGKIGEFTLKDSEYTSIEDIVLTEREFEAYEIVGIMVNSIGIDCAKRWFEGYEEVDEIIKLVETEQISLFNALTGINSFEYMSYSFEMLDEFMSKREDMLRLWNKVKHKHNECEKYNIYFYGFPISKISKSEAIWEVRHRYKNVEFKICYRIDENIDIVIKDSTYSSEVDEEIRKINEKNIVEMVNNGSIKYEDILKDTGGIKRVGERIRVINWTDFKKYFKEYSN